MRNEKGQFVKGIEIPKEWRLNMNPWNKGKTLDPESIRKRTETRRQRDNYLPWNKGKINLQTAWNKGLKGFRLGDRVSKIVRNCLVCANAFKVSFKERRKYCSPNCYAVGSRGRILSEEHRKKISQSQIGIRKKENPVTPIYRLIRVSIPYRNWRKAVFERDNWTCIWCGQREGKLHPDHIKMFALYPELRFEVSNGQTLCINCHAWKTKWDLKIFKGKVPELNIVYGKEVNTI